MGNATYRNRLAAMVRDTDTMAQFAAMSESLKAVRGYAAADSLRYALRLAFYVTERHPEIVADMFGEMESETR